MSTDRRTLIRKAASLPVGSDERREILSGLHQRTALKAETSQFIDWVILNQDPMSPRAMETYLEKILGREPTPYTKKTKRGPNIQVGDMLLPKPDKAPPQNQDVADQFKYKPCTVEKIDEDGVLVKFENGQTARFFGHSTGTKTGLYRYSPKSQYSEGTAKQHMEVVYFAKAGEVEPYRQHVVQQYQERGTAKGEDRKGPYYSGYLMGFKYTKDGDVIATIMSQQRPYPVSINPKKGRLLYLGLMRKRPNWKSDFERDVAELTAA